MKKRGVKNKILLLLCPFFAVMFFAALIELAPSGGYFVFDKIRPGVKGLFSDGSAYLDFSYLLEKIRDFTEYLSLDWKSCRGIIALIGAAEGLLSLLFACALPKLSLKAARRVFLISLAALLLISVEEESLGLLLRAFSPENNKPRYMEQTEDTEYYDYRISGGYTLAYNQYEDKCRYVFGKEVAIYAHPDTDSEIIFMIPKGGKMKLKEIDSDMEGDLSERVDASAMFRPTRERGWLYVKFLGGYVRTNSLLKALLGKQNPHWLNLTVRSAVMSRTYSAWKKGHFVAPDIPRAFAPLSGRFSAVLLAAALIFEALIPLCRKKIRRNEYE